MKGLITAALVVAFMLALSGWTASYAEDAADESAATGFVDEDEDGVDDGVAWRHRFGRRGMGFRGQGGDVVWVGTQLTEGQKTALKDKIDALKEQGATRDEIRAAAAGLLADFGIEVPEDGSWRLGLHRGGDLVWMGTELTEEQKAELKEKVDALKAEGAAWDEIRAAAAEVLTGFGIELPEEGAWRLGHSRIGGLSSLLTEDQLAGLKEKIDALKAEGATRADIRAAIDEELEALGVEAPARGLGKRGGFRGRGRR